MAKAKPEQANVPTVTRADVLRGLVEVGLAAGDCVLVHSSLSSMGRVEGGPDAVVDALLDAVGPKGTVVFPTFTGDSVIEAILSEGGAAKGPVFKKWAGLKVTDISRVNSDNITTGAIPKAARRRNDFVKSHHPLYSICAKGPLAAEIAECNDRYIFPCGERKFIHLMSEHGGKTLLLGTTHSTNSSIHLIAEFGGSEYKMQDKAYWFVTVKEYLKLSRKEQAAMLVPHLGGNLPYGLERHYDNIDGPLKKAGAIRFGRIGNAEVRLIKIADLVRVGLEELKRDPCFLVSKVPKSLSE